MSQVGAIFQAKRLMGRHLLASVRNESKLKIVVVASSAFLLWFGALYAFMEGFTWLSQYGPEPSLNIVSVGDLLMARLLSIFALALFIMLVFSNVLVSFSTMYQSHEVPYLLHTPLSYRSFFVVRFAESVSFSSWASAYLGSPLLIAYGLTTNAPMLYYPATALFYFPFVVIPAAIGSIVTMALLRVFPRVPRTALIAFGVAGLIALFFYIRGTLNAAQLAEDTLLAQVIQATAQTQSHLLPSYWVSHGILSAASAQYGEAAFQFMLLLANALMLVLIGTEVTERIFMSGYDALAGFGSDRGRPLNRGILGNLDRMLGFVRDPLRSLVAKDVKLFWRDPAQWTQFIVFFGIMAIYVANLKNQTGEFRSEVYRSWIAGLNIAACSLILATLTSRFIYPLISLEGRRFWILGLAPLGMRQLLWQKFWLSVFMTSPFTVGLVCLSCFILSISPIPFALSLYSIVLANLALAGLAVGLGSVYPNFEENNPARIVSGLGGTLNFLFSIAYIALVVISQIVILQWQAHLSESSARPFYTALLIVVLFNTMLTAAAIALPMHLGLRNLHATEF